MIDKKRFISQFIFIFLVFLILSNAVIAEKPMGQLINMNFKGADIRDVLRTIAELADINLVTDGSVQGAITVHLKNISFDEALTLITQSHGLAYSWDGNTVIVATPERIESIYTDTLTESIKIKYAELSATRDIIKGIYPDLNIQLDRRNKQLIVVGKKNEIKDVERIVKRIDIPEKKFSEIIRVKYTELNQLADHINAIYPELNIQKDVFNNQLIIFGNKEDIENALNLIKKLDIPQEKVTEVFKVNYRKPAEIQDKIKELIPELKIQLDESNNELIFSGKKKDVEQALKTAAKLDSKGDQVTKIVTINYGEIENIQQVISKFYTGLSLQVNKLKRELILHGDISKVKSATALIQKLDKPRRQVIIEARIEEISRNELLDVGVSPDQLSEINFIHGDNGQIDKVQVSWPDFLKAMEKKGSAQTLANPRLMTLNGEEAKLLIGDRIPYEVTGLEDGVKTSKIEYIDAGINLQFKPWISSDGFITLDVKPQVSSIGSSIGTALPPINTREAETKIRLRDGETFAIGGLIQDDVIESISKVPLLSEIPVLGEIFKSKTKSKIKTEVIIFITPHIVDESKKKGKESEEKKTGSEDQVGKLSRKGKVDSSGADMDNSVSSDSIEESLNILSSNKDNANKANETVENEQFTGLSMEEIDNILQETRKERESSDLPAFLNISHRVKKGETLAGIADMYGLSAEDIGFLNGLEGEPEPGSNLTIPIPESHLYRIKKGDTLFQLKQRFCFSVERLSKLNNIDDVSRIFEGEIIILPGDISDKR